MPGAVGPQPGCNACTPSGCRTHQCKARSNSDGRPVQGQEVNDATGRRPRQGGADKRGLRTFALLWSVNVRRPLFRSPFVYRPKTLTPASANTPNTMNKM